MKTPKKYKKALPKRVMPYIQKDKLLVKHFPTLALSRSGIGIKDFNGSFSQSALPTLPVFTSDLIFT